MASDFFSEESTVLSDDVKALTVTQLNKYVEYRLSSDDALRGLSVEGEISGFKRYYSSGHCYFTLKDRNSSVNCVMFKGNAASLTFSPSDGMYVIIMGYASLYSTTGQFQIYVERMLPVGEGELYAKFLLLKEELEAEGLFDEMHKNTLPYLPRTVGVVTSASGAVLHDIRNVVKRRFPCMNILLSPCSVQGTSAPIEIAEALKRLDESGLADVIILGRGGGSMEDLQCFNDELVARAIYECKTPVISAVGHETDFTIADFVADRRAPTPSAAAELAVPVYDDIKAELENTEAHIKRIISSEIEQSYKRIELAERGLATQDVTINMQEMRVSHIEERLLQITEMRLTEASKKLQLMLIKADALSPIKTLLRGYTYVKDNDGTLIKTATDFKKHGQGKVVFSDGEVDVKTV